MIARRHIIQRWTSSLWLANRAFRIVFLLWVKEDILTWKSTEWTKDEHSTWTNRRICLRRTSKRHCFLILVLIASSDPCILGCVVARLTGQWVHVLLWSSHVLENDWHVWLDPPLISLTTSCCLKRSCHFPQIPPQTWETHQEPDYFLVTDNDMINVASEF